MALTALHATQAVGTYTPEGELGPAEWNAAHTITGTLDVANGGTGASTAKAAAQALGVPYIFAQSGNPVSIGATVTEDVLATISFAGGEIGANGWVQVFTSWSVNSNVNAKNLRIRVGGAAGTIFYNYNATSVVGNMRPTFIINSNSQASQKSSVPTGNTTGLGQFTSAGPTSTVDTSAAWDLVITGQKANSADTITLEAYQVIVCYGA